MSIPEVDSKNRLISFLQNYLRFPKNPKFFVYLSSTVSNITDDAATVIAFNTVKSDNRDGYSTSTYRYTIPVDGTYYFSAQCLLNNVPTNTDAVGYLKFVHRDSAETSLGNYVGNYYSFHDFNSDSNFAYFPLRADAIIEAAAGQTVEVVISVDGVGGNTVDIFGHSSNLGATGFKGFLIL